MLRIALVGLGDIALKAYLPIMSCQVGVEPVLCTRQASVLAACAEKFRVREVYSDYDQLLNSRPDAVMIHSATESHGALVMAALEADIPVFVDKPLSYCLADAERMVELAEKRNILLFCGFNRRYAPLYQAALASEPYSVLYQKHRHRQAADARVFVYDDFIHVLDFVRHSCPGEPQDLQVASIRHQESLASVNVSWRLQVADNQTAFFMAAMNRVAGHTRERLEYFTEHKSWQVDNLRTGFVMHEGSSRAVGFGDWDDTLYKRGFYSMLDEFVEKVRERAANSCYLEGVLASHRLCEQVVKQIAKSG